jgi:heterodisulfide reductase subunit A-like polyferredoxin
MVERRIGAVIIATGSELENVEALGPNVYSIFAVERMLNSAGPTKGEVVLEDGRKPASIAFLRCAKATGEGPSEECSSICCMAFSKYAVELHHKLGDVKIYDFCSDECASGKGYRTLVARARSVVQRIHLEPGDHYHVVSGDGPQRTVSYQTGDVRKQLDVDMVIVGPLWSAAWARKKPRTCCG